MKLIVFILLFILPLHTIEASADLPVLFHHGIRKKVMDSSSQTVPIKESNVGNLVHEKRLLFISSNIKSSFFGTGIEQGLAQNTLIRLIDIYKDFGADFKKDIVQESKLEVLFERLPNNQKTEENFIHLTDNKQKSYSLISL